MVVRDVRHRWNYTHAMIRRAELLRKAIDNWVFEQEELRPLCLSNDEWRLLSAVGDLLEASAALSPVLASLDNAADIYPGDTSNVALKHTHSSLGSSNVRDDAEASPGMGIQRYCPRIF
ncbi:hypothetical protein DFH09DRAFT_1056581 [Mycena vulgaris]|nr:hypothetical protein DFH09DRAFT_1056581 [Mycena vulgaris]